jgi:DNA polymerase-3 subunit delta
MEPIECLNNEGWNQLKAGYMEIFEDIKKGKIDRLYLFYGQEGYVKEQALSQLSQALVAPGLKDLNYQVLDGEAASTDDIINACETLPFMSDRRLVVVKDLPALLQGGRSNIDEDRLKSYLPRIPSSTCLVFYCTEEVNKRKGLFTAIDKAGKVIEFELLKPEEIATWIRSTLKRHGKQMEPSALKYYVSIAGNRLEDIYNDLQKLMVYIGDRDVITRADIDKVVTPAVEYTVFQLVEAIGVKKADQALVLLHQLLAEGQNIFALLALIARQVRIIFQCKGLAEKGLSAGEIAQKLGLHPYAVKKGLEQSRYFSMEQLKRGLRECLKVDYGIKSGRIQQRLGIEMLIINMCKK